MAQQPDLQAILATLAQFSQQTPPTPQQQSQSAETNAINSSTTTHDNALAALQNATIDIPTDPRLRGRQSRTATPSQAQTQINPPPQAPSVIDPATITVWQDGLRCVTKIAAQNKMFEASIRRMMKDQRTNEMRWYSERQALKAAQSARSTSAAKAQSILQSLGQGTTVPAVAPQSEGEKAAELARFDEKVYAAQCSMDTAMTGELKGLGVPFFGTSEDLIVTEEQKPLSSARAKWSIPVTEMELLGLKQKMVGHLEMLYRD